MKSQIIVGLKVVYKSAIVVQDILHKSSEIQIEAIISLVGRMNTGDDLWTGRCSNTYVLLVGSCNSSCI